MDAKVPPSQITLTEAKGSSLRSVFLTRLQRLVRLRGQHEHELNSRGILLLDRTIFAVYYDCRRAGFEAEARELLRKAKFDLSRSQELGSVDDLEAPEDAA